MDDGASMAARLALIQSMTSATDYAQMIDESGSGNPMATQLSKNVIMFDSRRLISKFKPKDGTGGTDAILKPIQGLRDENVNELRQLFKMPTGGPKKATQDASRTLQPIKGLDLGTLELEQQKKEETQKDNRLKILQTHRAFSDHNDEDHHEKLQKV